MPLEDVLEYDHIWEPIAIGVKFSRNNKSKVNCEEGFRRYNTYVKIALYEKKKTKKIRYQVLALAVDRNSIELESKICKDYGITERTFRDYGREVMIKPVAMRATSGWSDPKEPHVVLDTYAISLPFTVQCSITTRGC